MRPLAAAIRIAGVAHEEQVDKLSAPYVEHPRRVAARVRDDPVAYATALMHDVIETAGSTTPAAGRLSWHRACPRSPSGRPAGRRRRPAAGALAQPAGRRVLRPHPREPDRTGVKLADLAENTDPARMAMLDHATRERLPATYAHGREILQGVG